jgi:endoglucanase
MNYFISAISICLVLLVNPFQSNAQSTIVEKYGKLQVKGNYLMSEHGDTVQLRGMSMFWSQWMGQFYNAKVSKWLRDDWKCTVLRAAMGVDEPSGYLQNDIEEKAKVVRMVKAAEKYGTYIIIDFHSHHAEMYTRESKRFFAEMAKKYGHLPNVIYEIYNEPLAETSWDKTIKPYAEEVIAAIREHDPDNLIIVGTRVWSQMVGEASLNPINDVNVAYTLHYYAASHGQELREATERALENGICVFVTEYGTCEYTGDGKLDVEASQTWWDFLDKHKISWCNWSVSSKEETASVLTIGAGWGGNWKEKHLTPSGKLVREELIKKNGPIFDSLVPAK